MSRLDNLGRRIAEEQERYLRTIQPAPASSNIGEYLLQRRDSRRNRRMALGALGLCLAVGGSFFALRSQINLPVEITTVRAEAGQTLATTSTEMAVVFADGSSARLLPGASLHTEVAKGPKAKVRLERGRVRVHVIHKDDTHFTVRSGPYTVEVTGTRFHVDWQPDSGKFSTDVVEGSVRIHGGLLPEPVSIQKGQSLTLEAGKPFFPPSDPSLSAGLATSPGTTLPAPTLTPPPAPIRAPGAASASKTHRLNLPRLASAADWRPYASSGSYREAMKAAEKYGFETICREASKGDLLTLAEAARFAGQPNRAEQALLALRTRFVRSDDAALAAYLLGRLAAEAYSDHQTAARWFRTYLTERPTGKLAREADGRLLESLAFTDRTTAQRAARSYLHRYPSGPHAPFARNLLAP